MLKLHMLKSEKFCKKNFICIVLVGIALICAICIWKIDKVYGVIKEVKESIHRELEYYTMHKKMVDISELPALSDENDAWYTKYHFIAHAGGGVEGRIYTNSLEAWENSYQKGNRVFDADMAFTSDGEMVLRHEWDENLELDNYSMREGSHYIDEFNGHTQYIYKMPEKKQVSYEEFMKSRIFYKYTPMSCDDMIRFMKKHDDLYVACDMKGDMKKAYQYLVKKAYELSSESILDRIIVNIYDHESYDSILEIYPFKNVTVRQHYWCSNNYYELVDFCLRNNIHVVNISSYYMEDEGVELLMTKGIHVYVAVVDYISDMNDYYRLGADGAVTNWLYEDDWKYIQ